MDNDELTASVWDDAVSPSNNDDFGSNGLGNSRLHNSVVAPLSNQFSSLAMDDPFANPLGFGNDDQKGFQKYAQDEDEDEEDEDDNDYNKQSSYYNAVDEQTHELKKEERKEHSNEILSKLTHGAEDSDILESSIVKSPGKISSSEALFHDKGSPLKVISADAETTKSPTRLTKIKTTKFKATRPRKFSSKINVQHMNESSTNPLGPLSVDDNKENENSESNPQADFNGESIAKEAEAPLYDINNGPDSPQKPSSIKSKRPQANESDPQSNKLEITVGDPTKVGDLTTAHVVYTIKTVNKNLDSKFFPAVESVQVSRRYRDFRWIYHQLQNNHPGRIIPPPPSKQTFIGRFNENFIENRRLSLEKMLSKINHHPLLCNDPDFVMFLTSQDFVNESKERERLSGSGASLQNSEYLDGNKDVAMSSNVAAAAATAAATSGGFMSSLFSMSTKVTEPDQYFITKKQYIDDLEYNLKQFYKTIELIGQQRLDMIGILDEIALTMSELAGLEISKVTSDLLSAFSEVELKIKDNLDRINLQDQLTLGFTIEEYLRIIGSINFVFDTRLNVYQQYHNSNQELSKKQAQLDKYTRKQQQPDKINQLNFEVDKLKQRTESFEKSFKEISETIKQELENFEYERIDDFRNSVEIFIESAIESQKEAIELYETFYERQNLGEV
ncbi:hypothetical protein MG9_03874 [Candida albicans P37037]|nr:hypothetical protein MG9_03874 [Candida albicans P37037]